LLPSVWVPTLASIRIVLGEVHQRVQGTEANRGLLVAELLDGLGI
jgi:hypothetical protein